MCCAGERWRHCHSGQAGEICYATTSSAQERAIARRERPRVRGRSRGTWLAPKPKRPPRRDRGRPGGL
eukprot:8013581-Pyramimonas_sp.AAC.1